MDKSDQHDANVPTTNKQLVKYISVSLQMFEYRINTEYWKLFNKLKDYSTFCPKVGDTD